MTNFRRQFWKAVWLLGGLCTVVVLIVAWNLFQWFEYGRAVTFVDVAQDRARLIDWIESYASVDEFVQQLKARSLPFEIDRPKSSGTTAYRPPYEITMITIPSFSHLGFSGDLIVAFFNNRLVGADFYPSDMNGYRKRLSSEIGTSLNADSEATPHPNTRIWKATDYKGRDYIGWEDVRLAEEMRLWIKRYS
jgi:hypothetical protein